MTDTNEHSSRQPDNAIRDILRAYPTDDDPQVVDFATELRGDIDKARRRMHIHTRKNLSHLAITSSLPNLGNLVHSQQVNAYDPSSGDSRDIAAFTLWTMEGHVLMADGSVARTPKQEDTLPDDHEGLVVVHDEELNEYPELLKNSLLKTVNRIATTMAMPTDHPTKWAEVKVTRALLRQTRRQARPDSGQARPEA